MPDQQTCAPPVIVTLPAQLDGAAAERTVGQITAAFTPGVSVVIADLTATACCDRAAIRNLLKAHRQATVRGGQVRFAIRPGGPLHQLTGFADTHPLLAVYPTLQHALTGRLSRDVQRGRLSAGQRHRRRDHPPPAAVRPSSHGGRQPQPASSGGPGPWADMPAKSFTRRISR